MTEKFNVCVKSNIAKNAVNVEASVFVRIKFSDILFAEKEHLLIRVPSILCKFSLFSLIVTNANIEFLNIFDNDSIYFGSLS